MGECLEGGEYLFASVCASGRRIVYIHDSFLNTRSLLEHEEGVEQAVTSWNNGCITNGLLRLVSVAKTKRTPVNHALWSLPQFVRCFSVFVWNYGIFHAVNHKDDNSYIEALKAVDSWLSVNSNGIISIFQASLPGAGDCGCAISPAWHPTEGRLHPCPCSRDRESV